MESTVIPAVSVRRMRFPSVIGSTFAFMKLPITAWRREREQLEQECKDIQTELSPLHADAKKLWAIHYNIYEVQHEQERQNAATQQKKQEIEH